MQRTIGDNKSINTDINKISWLNIGLKIIGNQGLNELKISTLCKILNVTKGSFYYWFKSKSDYEMQILKLWKKRFTNSFIECADKGNSDKHKLSLLCSQCIDGVIHGNRLEFEINAWSFKNDEVREFVYSVYKERFGYLKNLLRGIFSTEKEIQKHALTLYSLVIGVDFFYRKLTLQELELIFSDYLL